MSSDLAMGKSKAQECTTRGTVHLVKWRPKKTTRGFKARWVPDKRTNTSKSARLSPTKSPAKQPSDGLMYRFSDDFYGGYDDQGDINPMRIPQGPWKNKRKKKTMASQSPFTLTDGPNEYLQQWKVMAEDYLDMLIEWEGPPPDRVCCLCDGDGVQKCHNCLAEPMFCTKCCQTQHAQLPFHWISQWNGDFFERTALTKLGMEIHLGHGGRSCPHHYWDWEDTDDGGQSAASSTAGTPGACDAGDAFGEGPSASAYYVFSQDVDDTGAGDVFLEEEYPPYAKDSPVVGKTWITVVDTSGVHTMWVWFCQCADARTPDKQLFEIGLFPASFTRPKTAFTFALLDDFILDNLECGTLAMNYYSKLRRITSSMFPHLVPDRYRELMRVSRQWWQLKLLKWNGFSHDRKDPKDGELALFCPACPQPGINVTLPTEDDDTMPEWLYSCSLVMNGNFKAEHLHPTHPEDEVWLTDGQSFMVARARYQAHLGLAKDSAQRSECNNHRAVNQANASRHKLEATGIGGCACARHGCFMPNSMVDFQKGERQMNMLCQALTFYDVNCQYNKHLQQRVDESLHLSLPSGMDIIPGIGLWHVHGHQDKCYVRYASNFIPGAARIDGEIMETLWAPLNIISPSTRGMSTPHRQECLDYQMNDCNYMKMIWMGLFLSRKYKEAKRGVAESTKAFNALNDAADPEMVKRWEAQERAAQASQIDDPSALDIYDVQLQKGKSPRTRKEVEVDLLQTSIHCLGERPQLGAATWLASGITIEEMQITLAMDIRRMGRHPTKNQVLEMGRRWIRLQHSIDEFVATAGRYLGDDYDSDHCIPNMDVKFLRNGSGSSDEDADDDGAPGVRHPTALFRPKIVVIPLPSNLGMERCRELGVAGLIRQEITLREGQANDMLHAIRVHLADKVVLFRTTVRPAKSQARTTQAWAQVHLVEWVIDLNSMIYKKCRAQLQNLGADQLLQKYRELEKSHLKATSAVADPNTRGQRNSTLPWFWSLDVQGDSVSDDWMNEFYRVHWLRTKALRDHWAEEFILVGHEMRWTINFLMHRSATWLGRTHQNGDPTQVGNRCYALRQAQMYKRLAEDAHAWFVEVNLTFGHDW
ncbi:uncharacterized protein EDB91DRAFT_1256307 [Suillus paluster]|uniref:uncharacterized protein n=1 Tax=Suillus paluster TaxID=48578 RepID=UPI001B867F83|nr:uncharacterized protein EDB91DRAFT_1256307 [Suillus paluster]KAG1721902.1 hypothetical protein EDB91DRAFT_1256307 [Suillus paluster]